MAEMRKLQTHVDITDAREKVKSVLGELKSYLLSETYKANQDELSSELTTQSLRRQSRQSRDFTSLCKKLKDGSAGIFSSAQNLIRCKALFKLRLSKALTKPHIARTRSDLPAAPCKHDCTTITGRIEQMYDDTLNNRDCMAASQSLFAKEAEKQDFLNPIYLADRNSESSCSEYWDDHVEEAQELNLLRYRNLIAEKVATSGDWNSCFCQDEAHKTDRNEDKMEAPLSVRDTIKEAREQLRAATQHIETIYLLKDKETSLVSATTDSSLGTNEKDGVVPIAVDQPTEEAINIEELLSSSIALELQDKIPVLPEIYSEEELPYEGGIKMMSDIIIARLHRIWFILQMPVEEKTEMVLNLTRAESEGLLHEKLNLWELAAAAVLHREHILLQLQELRINLEERKGNLDGLAMELCSGMIFVTRNIKTISEKLKHGLRVKGDIYLGDQSLSDGDIMRFLQWCLKTSRTNDTLEQ